MEPSPKSFRWAVSLTLFTILLLLLKEIVGLPIPYTLIFFPIASYPIAAVVLAILFLFVWMLAGFVEITEVLWEWCYKLMIGMFRKWDNK